MTNSHIKQSPFVGYAGFGGGATALALKSAASKTYIDDVFSNYVYRGDGSTQTITNNIDLSGEGGMVWIKRRNSSSDHQLYDTVRGTNKGLSSDSDAAVWDYGNGLTAFNSTGFTLGALGGANASGDDQMSWTFRKKKGFFDVQTWTGDTNTNQTVSHDLGCQPGCIIYKCTSTTSDWKVYHIGLNDPATYSLTLNGTGAEYGTMSDFGSTAPTTSAFTAGPNYNTNGETYVAYIYAGGYSPSEYSTLFADGNCLNITGNSDLDLDGDFTIEAFVYCTHPNNNDRQSIIGNDLSWTTNQFEIQINNPGSSQYYDFVTVWDYNTDSGAPVARCTGNSHVTGNVLRNQWNHVAVTRESGTIKIFVNGILSCTPVTSQTQTFYLGTGGTDTLIGKTMGGGSAEYFVGNISNLRVVKGQALYTKNFRIPEAALTTTSQGATASNVKLLCCNTSPATGSTVTPATISATGSPSASSLNSFMDADSFKFGEDQDKNIIACGKYVGLSEANNGPEINIGWEPQWVLIKKISGTASWQLFDTIRGIGSDANDMYLNPDNTLAETTTQNRLRTMPFGFKLDENDGDTNTGGQSFIYIAIRHIDGYVGKPAEAGTDVFTMDMGNGSTTLPTFDANFPVNLGLSKQPGNAFDSWYTNTWNMRRKYVYTNSSVEQQTDVSGTDIDKDWMKGYGTDWSSSYQSWMWKKCQGFDRTCYFGTGEAGLNILHNLGTTPQMIWVKRRSAASQWAVYHYGANGGVTPWEWSNVLDDTTAFADSSSQWNDTAPTSNDVTLGDHGQVNEVSNHYLMLLWASVEGISKVGYFSGNGSSQSITFGFQPRLLFIMGDNVGDQRWLFDSVNGFNTALKLNSSAATSSAVNGMISATSTGIDINGTDFNGASQKFVYYAHA